MKFRVTKLPLYVILLAVYSPLSLLASNFREIEPKHFVRPALFSILLSIGIFYLIGLFLFIVKQDQTQESKNLAGGQLWKDKVGLLTIIFIFIFLNYGRAFIFLRNQFSWSASLGNNIHLILIPLSILLFWFSNKIIQKQTKFDSTPILLFCITLLVLPSYNIGKILVQEQKSFEPTELKISESELQQPLPDIYHIVLDAYSREDYLSMLGYDNSDFLNFLRDQGFYVADCSRSNYSRTALSLTSTLNADYLWQVFPEKNAWDRDDAAVYAALSNNLAHNVFHELGYQFITTVNGYPWSEHTQYADVVVMPEEKGLLTPYILPFEKLFIENSALRILLDFGSLNEFKDGYLLNGLRYEQMTNALEYLKGIPSMPGPKYVYYHLTVPHSPYIYSPDGSIAPDLRGMEGYLRTVDYINNQIKPIISTIIKESATPPIIVIHGDHGYMDDQQFRFLILYALYLPGVQVELYPEISPVNTYRLIFTEYFGANLSLLRDESIQADIGGPFRKNPAQLPDIVSQCP